MKVRLHNHCCRGKAINIKYYECVSLSAFRSFANSPKMEESGKD
jgi:hypothetical protein